MALSKFSSSECEFVEPTSKDFDCPICFQVVWNPFLTECCGNHFCEACVKSTKEKGNQCPFCNEKPINGIIDKKFLRQLKELRVYCLHKKHGCLWVGEMGELTKHLGEDKPDGECEFVLLSCSLSCGKQIFRCKLDEHVTKECPLRTHTCEYCDYSSTYEDITTIHYSNCPNYPMICPNSCSEEKLKRSSLDHHLLTCPDEVVSCSFNEMGCEERMKRQCLPQHIEANVMKHQLMICDAFKNVKKENENLKNDIMELQKKNAAMKSALSRMDNSTIGFVLKMDEGIATHQWKEYFSSLATVSTDDPNPVSPVIIKWPEYSEVKQIAEDAKSDDTNKHYYTRPFYTHLNGYKMQLSVFPCGDEDNDNISVYSYLMRGENDDHLRWPFNGTIVITLLNQLEDSKHFSRDLHLGGSIEHEDVVKKLKSNEIRSSSGWGFPKFIPLSVVESSTPHHQYLMNNTLYFKISTTVS